MKRLFSAMIASIAIVPALTLDLVAAETDIEFELNFRLHVDDGSAEQDVYVAHSKNSKDVWRPRPDFSALNAPLYTSATAQAHMPFDLDAVGPFPKGRELGLTLGEWLAANGQGNYRCEAGQGHLELAFTDLVPNGVYTVWHFFLVNAPTEPFIGSFDLPVGAFDGSQAGIVADSDGNAVFDQVFANCLQLSGEQLMAGLALNWHSDGHTYGMLPGDFGQNAHIQLYTALPKRPDL